VVIASAARIFSQDGMAAPHAGMRDVKLSAVMLVPEKRGATQIFAAFVQMQRKFCQSLSRTFAKRDENLPKPKNISSIRLFHHEYGRTASVGLGTWACLCWE
jgi:hypothetical protein